MKLIKLSDTHYIIVDDSDIKVGDFVYSMDGIHQWFGDVLKTEPLPQKITHSTQSIENHPDLDYPFFHNVDSISLSEVEEAIYGYSVKKMAWKLFGGSFETRNVDSEEEANKVVSFGIECIKAHQELVKDKLFTIDDMRKAFIAGVDWQECGTILYPDENGFIQSLLPKTEWDIEIVNNKIVLK